MRVVVELTSHNVRFVKFILKITEVTKKIKNCVKYTTCYNIIMEILIVTLILTLSIIIIQKTKQTQQKQKYQIKYNYQIKKSVMTIAEVSFYKKLTSALHDNFIIVPQAHLSMIFNHTVYGQNWRGAFSVINGKSIDFLIIDRGTFQPLLGIELDDSSHERHDRQERDKIVNTIFKQTNLPLVRFSTGEWNTPNDINQKVLPLLESDTTTDTYSDTQNSLHQA